MLYTYDSLNRLATAQTAGAGGWGQSYTFDGFGNLTDQTVIKGSAPGMSVAYSASTNRQTGDTADANGNILGSATPSLQNVFDIENRMTAPGGGATMRYSYDAGNKRVWRGDSATALDEITLWGGDQRLASYTVNVNYGTSTMWFTLKETSVYFGKKLVSKGTYNSGCTCADKVTLTAVAQDRLGSINKYYPFGQERPSASANDKEKFTGYYRDAVTGPSGTLDYADQRYHQSGVGRFMSPDPYKASAGATDPGSWNRYAYVGGDPVNTVDPRGLFGCNSDFCEYVYDWGGSYYIDWWDYQFIFGGFRTYFVDQSGGGATGGPGQAGGGAGASNTPASVTQIPGVVIALQALGKEDCWKFLGFENGADAITAFFKMDVRIGDADGRLKDINFQREANGDLTTDVLLAFTDPSGVVWFSKYFWPDITSMVDRPAPFNDQVSRLDMANYTFQTNLSGAEMGAATLLHELGHVVRGKNMLADLNNIGNSVTNYQNIVNQCLNKRQ